MDALDKENMYSIGALSKIVQISTDTLRYYDEIGLFKPAYISEETGYRYYTLSQASTLVQILELKQYGFTLSEISGILKKSKVSLMEAYQECYWKLLKEKQRIQETADKLAMKIKQLQEE